MTSTRRSFTPLHTSTMPLHTSTMPEFTVGSAENAVKNEHWVAKLFQPTYLEDIGDSSTEMKTILGKRLTAIDPEALKNVFHRVHALLAEQKEMIESKPWAPSEPAPPTEPEKRDVSTDESCIWDESEISLLRQAYKTLRDENRKLKSHLKFAEQRLASLDAKFTNLRRENDERGHCLHEARQANTRLQIMAETLKGDIQSTETENITLNEHLQSLKMERLDLIDKLKKSRIESDHDRIEKKRLELEVRENGKTLLETAAHLESKLRVKYQREVNEFNFKIEELQEELADERKTHAATKRGLDHLRTHFSSMPLDSGLVKDEFANLKLY